MVAIAGAKKECMGTMQNADEHAYTPITPNSTNWRVKLDPGLAHNVYTRNIGRFVRANVP